MLKRLKESMVSSDEEDNVLESTVKVRVARKIKEEEAREAKRPVKEPQLNEVCTLCNKVMFDANSIETHLQSKKHKINMRKQTLSEIADNGNIRTYLVNKGFVQSRRSKLQKLTEVLYHKSLGVICSRF